MIDAHTHLTEEPMRGSIDQVIDDFVKVGGVALVTQSMNTDTFLDNIEIVRQVEEAEKDCIVKTTRGRHPREVVQGTVDDRVLTTLHDTGVAAIESYEDEVVAVGECGIDLHYEGAEKTLQTQQSVLHEHCRLALGYDLPVVVHSRDAFRETMDVLADYPDMVVYMHCWGYGPDEVEEFLRYCPRGYIGFCGNITYKNAENLRESVAVVPRDRLVLETDAPYLAPQVVRGLKNQPALITHTYDYVAGLLDVGVDVLRRQVTENFYALYHL